jgi:eukaryotic-like serine/threonine-protein kinase
MEITAGSRLGPYEIVSRIGVGGMGEVWRARDTRLERQVAIKVLPPDLANDSGLKRRFEREAQTVSQLAHPNICTLFDVGENYLVMELLDGETLADRLQRGPLPFDEVLRYGIQIADALDKAHRQGVIHRDLKPGNVMLTKSGAKLLDFGLAKTERSAISLNGKSAWKSLTQEGTILGTFQYMAPEQLEGGKADARTDIFAFGAMLYEMITSKPAFDAASNMSLIAKIVAGEPPPISQTQRAVPPALERVISKCLKKDPDDRWQSAHDVGDELRWIATAGPNAGLTPGSRLRQWMRTGSMVAGWIVAAIGIAAAAWYARSASERRPLSVEIQPPRDTDFAHHGIGFPALSPDGSRLAFLVGAFETGSATGIVVRDLGTGTSKVLEGTVGASYPFWSPDGKSLGFFQDRRLKAMNVDDGANRVICEAPNARGGSWGSTGVIIFSPDLGKPIHRVSAGGGKPAELTKLPNATWAHRLPHFLPDGEHFLFIERSQEGNIAHGRIAVASLTNPQSRVLVERGSNVAYSNGHLLYVTPDGTLVAHKFNVNRLAVEGEPVTVADNVWYWVWRDQAYIAASPSGILVYRQSPNRMRQLAIVDRAGLETNAIGNPGEVGINDISSDRRFAAVVIGTDTTGRDAWVVDIARGTMTRASFEEAKAAMAAVCSSDCSRLAVSVMGTADSAKSSLWLQPQSGGGTRDVLAIGVPFIVSDWSSDDRYIFGTYQQPGQGFDIAYVDLKGARKLVPILTGKFDESSPRISPDGKWLAYYSAESGRRQLYVSPFPALDRKWQVAEEEFVRSEWSPDGRELFVDNANGTVASISLDLSGPEPKIGQLVTYPLRGYAATFAAGDRFLAERLITGTPEPLRLVVNWTQLLPK